MKLPDIDIEVPPPNSEAREMMREDLISTYIGRNILLHFIESDPELRTRFAEWYLQNVRKSAETFEDTNIGNLGDPPKTKPFYRFWSDKFSDEYARNALLYFIHRKGLDSDCNRLLEKHFSSRREDCD